MHTRVKRARTPAPNSQKVSALHLMYKNHYVKDSAEFSQPWSLARNVNSCEVCCCQRRSTVRRL